MNLDTQPLRDAVDLLARVGREAGLDEATVRAEGAALAAAVLEEPGPGQAHTVWAQAFGVQASDYFGAAPKGRRYANIPTTLLSTLVAEGSPRAAGYAQALADVATTAATLSGGPLAVGKAASVARVQLAATGTVPAHGPGTPTAGLTPPSPTPPAGSTVTGSTTDGPTGTFAHGGFPLPLAAGSLPGSLRDVTTDLLRQAKEQSERMRQMLGHLGDQPGGSGGGSVGTPPPAPGAFDPAGGLTDGTLAPTGTGYPPAGGTAYPTSPDQVATQPPPEGTAAPTEPEEPAEPERSVEELLAELDELIGLERVKAEIHRQVAVLKMDARRQEAGLKVATLTRHLVFVGNPGTGKTTVARLVGGIYRALTLLSKGQLVEVDRSELVAGYLGQTAAKTAEVVKSAIGGVLFIDEAYSLNGDQYGKEAIDTLVKEMEDHRDDLVVIVAGYPAPMAEFIAMNPGLESRFRTIIEFDDYTDDELVAIQETLAEKMDYDIAPEAQERFREILAATPRGPSFGNGRFARNMLEAAIGRHAWRLRDIEDPTVEDLRTLRREDFEDRDAVDLSVEAAAGVPADAPTGGMPSDGTPGAVPVGDGPVDLPENADPTAGAPTDAEPTA